MIDDRWTFVMATPDAVLGGQLDFVVERVEAHGFAVRACRVLGLTYERLGRMYVHADVPPTYTGNRTSLPPFIMDPTFRLSPAVVLVVERAAGDACAEMLRAKGVARPEQSAAGTIRAAGENYVYNLVHCPDDAGSAAIELAHLVGKPDAAGLIAIACGSGHELEALVGVNQLCLCLPVFEGREALSFASVANRIRCRIVQKHAALTGSGPARPVQLLAAQAALARERLALVRSESAAERAAIGRGASAGIHAALAAVPTIELDATTASALDALAALYDEDGRRDLPALRALGGTGVYISAAEAVSLECQAYTCWRDVR